ncbi:MAG TPA: GAF domain-containing protein [Anaerolineae bacterium]|nr:GAF domain-containing protein [Anaerolineae bacterium]HQK13016.1 GAF domain-containing protein [Anaerolineae bacterium]
MKGRATEVDQSQQEETLWRQRIFEKVARFSAIGAAGLIVAFVVLWLFRPKTPLLPLLVVAAFSVLLSLLALFFSRRGRLQTAVILYIIGLTLTTFVSFDFAGGVTGPLLMFLLLLPILAGQFGGITAVRWNVLIIILFWIATVVLESLGVLTPVALPADIARYLSYATFLTILLLIAVIVNLFVKRGQQSLAVVRERERALAESIRLAETAAEAERAAREHATHAASHLRETVAGYAEYLARVAAGDYTARVDVGVLDENVEGDTELHALGEYLNATVDALLQALQRAQETQRRYTEQAWQDVIAAGRVQPGFAYRQNQIIPEAEWLPQMVRAVDSGAPVAQDEGAAVPLVINRQVVGAIGGRHPDGRPWTTEELSLIEDVTGQLAQTIEGLRLFDDVQRRAARERVLREITARIRSSTDPEMVLKSLLREVGSVLNRPAFVRLVTPTGETPVDAAERRSRDDEEG